MQGNLATLRSSQQLENKQVKAIASFPTHSANRYLAQLCDHFGRKIKAEHGDAKGSIEFPFGRCQLTASDSDLEILAQADDQARLDQVIGTLTSHLERFAFRENPFLDWQKIETNQPT